MNKNLNNQDGKGPQGGQIQNQGIKQNGTHTSEKRTNPNRERDRLDSSTEKNLVTEKRPIVMGAGTMQNKNAVDGSPSSRTQAMNDRGPVFKSSTFQAETQNQNLGGKLAEELKAPVITGTAFYVIAALLLIVWAVGFFYYNAGTAIHVLLVLALVSVLIRVAQGRNY